MADPQTTRLRICLAASGGGHLRQILDLAPFWERYDHYFVTEPTPLAESLAADHRVRTVPHFALGQAKVQSTGVLIASAVRNLIAAWRHAREERPDLVISTGAGSAFFPVLFARLFGAKFVLIESFARVHRPSLFGRLARPFANKVVVQSAHLLDMWPNSELCDPLVLLGPTNEHKDDLGFVTVGTVMPFDRLVNAVAALPEGRGRPSHIVAQVGGGGAMPDGLEGHERMGFDEIQRLLSRANIVFCHGGTGSLVTALRVGCRVVAMPRRPDLGEHYDDHQREIVTAFAAHGLIEVAEGPGDLQAALERALNATPQRATTDPSKLISRLDVFVTEWFMEKISAPLSY
ncbi:beta-1,4-glucuronosyltransferase WelK [Sphingosinicella rhizophila]|uniref:Glycosyltransferase n=1 Tax=Sphingosinicella rhizophila TaxID=3050082 RepID=A0ABU3Q3L9_9SPHN|nr:glycosyltransferase [Sphingosinicella sp. GR2756]MDT9598012.1 glycosyltransferase [Sphingosinicella sp. GR2756]